MEATSASCNGFMTSVASTVRSFLTVVAARNREVHQMEVHNAFLHGDLDEEVYMKPLPGFHAKNDGHVCRL